MIKIRLARAGRLNRPIYSIVATDTKSCRDSNFLQKLGQYDPRSQTEVLKNLNLEAINTWLSQGAQLSETLRTVFKKEKVQINL